MISVSSGQILRMRKKKTGCFIGEKWKKQGMKQENDHSITSRPRVTGVDIPYQYDKKRPGDPAILVASADKMRTETGWRPDLPSLETIIQTAWEWHSRHPNGYSV